MANLYGLADFADLLGVASVKWSIHRNDELSGLGDGRVWQAELAPPIWTGDVALVAMRDQEAKQIAALIRALNGAQETFLFTDPRSCYPQSDPGGVILGSAQVTVNSIAADRRNIRFKGLPARYSFAPGDKFSITYGDDRVAFHEISVFGIAGATGISPLMRVFPNLPTGIVADMAVTLLRPACKCIIFPDSHDVGTSDSEGFVKDQTFRVIQKK